MRALRLLLVGAAVLALAGANTAQGQSQAGPACIYPPEETYPTLPEELCLVCQTCEIADYVTVIVPR